MQVSSVMQSASPPLAWLGGGNGRRIQLTHCCEHGPLPMARMTNRGAATAASLPSHDRPSRRRLVRRFRKRAQPRRPVQEPRAGGEAAETGGVVRQPRQGQGTMTTRRGVIPAARKSYFHVQEVARYYDQQTGTMTSTLYIDVYNVGELDAPAVVVEKSANA